MPKSSSKKENSFQRLRDKPKAVPKNTAPAPKEVKEKSEEFVDFLKDPQNKDDLKNFIIDTYKALESEKINQFKAKVHNELQSDANKIEDFHTSSNISPLLDEAFNMNTIERAFSRGLKSTKDSLDHKVDERVDEINRLLSGIGGFSSQIRSSFARCTVVFLEQDDPVRNYRERLIFSIHLPNFELKKMWNDENESRPKNLPKNVIPLRKSSQSLRRKGKEPEDQRTSVQTTWDDAINALSSIIEKAGLRAKYCKNDRNYGRFVMKQDLRNSSVLPDEYFSLTLDYNTQEKLKEMTQSYNAILRRYNRQVGKLEKKVTRLRKDDHSRKSLELRRKFHALQNERDYFVATVPDPNQLEEGLLFLIEVSTLKDYHIVKDKMQSIMTKFILHLSSIAAKDAEIDPDLEYELWKSGQHTGADAKQNQAQSSGSRGGSFSSANDATPYDDVLDQVDSYEVDEADLKPIGKSKKAA